jgi:hypothetical protein
VNVSVAPSAERDIERHYERLQRLAAEGIASPGRQDIWFRQLEQAIESLTVKAHQHGFAYEREAWGRDVRLALFAAGYRILFEIHGDDVWVLRIRSPRQNTLRRPGPGSAYPRSRR